jgi:proteasome accessory factor C
MGNSQMMKSSERLERLISMVPWLIENNGASIGELASRFQYPEETLITDLTKVLFFVGPHPHTPGDLIEINLYEGEVWINQAQFLAKPLRLKPREAFSLLIKGKMLLNLIKDNPDSVTTSSLLNAALVKLSTSVSLDQENIELASGIPNNDVYQSIQKGIELGTKITVSYYSFNTDKNTERVVHPIAFNLSDRYLYLDAYCEMAEGYRTFRLDRIVEVQNLSDPIDLIHSESELDTNTAKVGELEFSFADSESATLLIDSEDEWIIAKYPTTNVEVQENKQLLVTLPVSTGTWLGRLLLRLNPETKVVATTEAISESLNDFNSLIGRILNRYES